MSSNYQNIGVEMLKSMRDYWQSDDKKRKRSSLAKYILVRYLLSLLVVSLLTVFTIYWVLHSTQTDAIELSEEATEDFLVQAVQYEVRNYHFESLQLSLSAFRDALAFKRIDVIGPYGKPIAESGDILQETLPNSVIPIISDTGTNYGTIRIWYSEMQNSWAQSNENARAARIVLSIALFAAIVTAYSFVFYYLIRRHINDPLSELVEHMNHSQQQLLNKGEADGGKFYPFPEKLAQFEETRALGLSYKNLERRWLSADRQRATALASERHQRSTLLEVLNLAKITVAYIEDDGKLHFAGTKVNSNIRTLLQQSNLDEEIILARAENYGWSAQDTVFRAHKENFSRFVELEDEKGQKWSLHKVKIDHKNAVILREVTQERSLEQALSRSEKLKAIGTLSSSIAHDFNNIISTILVNIELIRSMINNEERVPDDLFEGIEQSASGIASRIGSIRRVALEQDARMESVDQAQRLKELELFVAPSLGADISIKLDIQDESPVRCDDGEFESSIVNLLVNAKQAMDGYGEITIRTRRAQKEDLAHIESHNKPYLAIDVQDNGPGVSSDIANLIFDPFYSTRKLTDGTGLGLAQVQAFALRAGGHVYLNRRGKRKGACFTLVLPKADNQKIIKSPKDIAEKAEPNQTNIYVLDDNIILAKTTSALLDRHGFAAHPFGTLGELRALAHEQNGLNGILLSDVHMPDCGFKDVMNFVQSNTGDLKIAYYSGNEESLTSINKIYPKTPTLLKPFQTVELVRFLRKFKTSPNKVKRLSQPQPKEEKFKGHLH